MVPAQPRQENMECSCTVAGRCGSCNCGDAQPLGVHFTFFPYRDSFPTFRSLLQSELVRFLPVAILIGIVLVLALDGWQVWLDLQSERTRATDLERQVAVSRLDALRMELHPHFLFNTLHAVAGLIFEQPPIARRMVIALSDLLRLTLKDAGGLVRSLAEELEFADLYLGIEKLRLGDHLVLDYDIPSPKRPLLKYLSCCCSLYSRMPLDTEPPARYIRARFASVPADRVKSCNLRFTTMAQCALRP
jgi:hypothetical protein